MKIRILFGVVIAILSFCTGSLVSHHTTDAVFDLANPKILKGVITSVDFVNPHSYMFMDVTTCKTDNYAVELGSIAGMYRANLDRNRLKPGVAISLLSASAKRSYTTSRPDVAERAKSQHFVLGGCITLASGEKVEYGEGPKCPTPVKPIPEEGILPR